MSSSPDALWPHLRGHFALTFSVSPMNTMSFRNCARTLYLARHSFFRCFSSSSQTSLHVARFSQSSQKAIALPHNKAAPTPFGAGAARLHPGQEVRSW